MFVELEANSHAGMRSTKALKNYDCSFIEYFAGRRVVRSAQTPLIASSVKSNSSLAPAKPTTKVDPKLQAHSNPDEARDDERISKQLRWDEKELRKIEKDSVSEKRLRNESKELYSEGGVKIKRRPPQEHASDCADCNIVRYGVPVICDTCIRKGKHKACDDKKSKRGEKGKKQETAKMPNNSKKNDWWDGDKPAWASDQTNSGWGNNANNTNLSSNNNAAGWGINVDTNNSTNWDSNNNATWGDNGNSNEVGKWGANNGTDNNNLSSWGNNQNSNMPSGWVNAENAQGDVNNSSGGNATNSSSNKQDNNSWGQAGVSNSWTTNNQNSWGNGNNGWGNNPTQTQNDDWNGNNEARPQPDPWTNAQAGNGWSDGQNQQNPRQIVGVWNCRSEMNPNRDNSWNNNQGSSIPNGQSQSKNQMSSQSRDGQARFNNTCPNASQNFQNGNIPYNNHGLSSCGPRDGTFMFVPNARTCCDNQVSHTVENGRVWANNEEGRNTTPCAHRSSSCVYTGCNWMPNILSPRQGNMNHRNDFATCNEPNWVPATPPVYMGRNNHQTGEVNPSCACSQRQMNKNSLCCSHPLSATQQDSQNSNLQTRDQHWTTELIPGCSCASCGVILRQRYIDSQFPHQVYTSKTRSTKLETCNASNCPAHHGVSQPPQKPEIRKERHNNVHCPPNSTCVTCTRRCCVAALDIAPQAASTVSPSTTMFQQATANTGAAAPRRAAPNILATPRTEVVMRTNLCSASPAMRFNAHFDTVAGYLTVFSPPESHGVLMDTPINSAFTHAPVQAPDVQVCRSRTNNREEYYGSRSECGTGCRRNGW